MQIDESQEKIDIQMKLIQELKDQNNKHRNELKQCYSTITKYKENTNEKERDISRLKSNIEKRKSKVSNTTV